MARPARICAYVAPPAYRAHDQARVFVPQFLIAEAEPVHHPGTERFHDHVCTSNHRSEGVPAFPCFQVNGKGPLVAIEADEACRGGVGVLRAHIGGSST